MSLKRIITIVFLFATMFLVACSVQSKEQSKGELTRIDVISLFEEKDIEYHIQLTEELTLVESAYQKVNWQPNTEPKMSREPDVVAIFFYTFDENMPERLVNYQIWFNQGNDTATIISDYQNEGFGTLDKGNAESLKQVFMKARQTE